MACYDRGETGCVGTPIPLVAAVAGAARSNNVAVYY
jgi:hypothetical protein